MGINWQAGNMYPWVTGTFNPVKGICPHECIYCYMRDPKYARMKEPRLEKSEFKTDLGKDNTFFVGSSIDLFAEAIPGEWIQATLDHCQKFPDNEYFFQSKNPSRFMEGFTYPPTVLFGTTIESNRDHGITKAPGPKERFRAIRRLRAKGFRTMVSIEPIMDFDLDEFAEMLLRINPEFISIGADSKDHDLCEPTAEKVMDLIDKLEKYSDIKLKKNLGRLL
jgi:DNA repair photolyase